MYSCRFPCYSLEIAFFFQISCRGRALNIISQQVRHDVLVLREQRISTLAITATLCSHNVVLS